MNSSIELSFSDDDTINEQGEFAAPTGDTLYSNRIYLSDAPINIKITHVYWTSRFNYFRDHVRCLSFPQCLTDDSTITCEESISTVTMGKIPNHYEIVISHGPYEWKILKTYNEIFTLHQEIDFDQFQQRAKQAIKQVKSFVNCLPSVEAQNLQRLSVFPKRWILAVPEEKMAKRTKLLEDYLQSIVNYKPLRYLEGVMNFFEVSPLTFCLRLGTYKFKEGSVLELPKFKKLAISFCDCSWKSRWMVLKDSYLVMLKKNNLQGNKALPMAQRRSHPSIEELTLQTIVGNNNTKESHQSGRQSSTKHHYNKHWHFCKVILMDQFFKVSIKHKCVDTILNIKNMHYNINLRTQRPNDWVAEISKVVSRPPALDSVHINPNDSFAPVRRDENLLPCVDGAAYMDAVANGIDQAQFEIFITDWWLSPEIFLKRSNGGDRWRLDCLLKRKAEQGLRICILIYREVRIILTNDSKHAATWLSGLHPNISVLRHPDHIRDSPLLWSHHEKLIVIDQSIVFVGGIDLCFGRWNGPDHPLIDVDKTKPYRRSDVKTTGDEKGEAQHEHSPVTGALPKEVGHGRQKGHGDSDGQPIFVVGADFASKQKASCSTNPLMALSSSMRARKSFRRNRRIGEGASDDFAGDGASRKRGRRDESKQTMDIQITNNGHLHSCLGFNSELGQLSRRFLFVGKDYQNSIFKEPDGADKPEIDQFDRNEIPRMPWHDVGCAITGPVVSDFARHFIQRWNATRLHELKRRQKQHRLPIPPMLLPSPPCEPWIHAGLSAVSGRRYYSALQMQALRSSSRWSLVVKRRGDTGGEDDFTERSIHNAYVDAIRNSKHYVYIENQFFVSWLNDETMAPDIQSDHSNNGSSPTALEGELQHGLVKNLINQALYDRILRAHREKKPYRVYIVMPLLPGFEGDPGSKEKGKLIHTQMHFIRKSLFQGPTALIPRLRFFISNPMDYISVCGLRNYDFWSDHRLTTEIIYVHTKLMIVDDRKLIVGSANINDRSMLGNRDGELALLAEDIPEMGALKEAKFAGEKVFVGNMARNFRKFLMAEHLGVLMNESREHIDWNYKLLNDPVGEEFYQNVWCRIAESNMKIFDDVFKCLPSYNAESFEEVKLMRMEKPMYESNPNKAEKLVKHIQGHLVRFPDEFLSKEDLYPFSIENVFTPTIWT